MSLNKEFLGKKYKCKPDKNENYENYLTELGVKTGITRKLLTSSSTVMDIQMDGNQYAITLDYKFRKNVIKFTPGIEFYSDLFDRKVHTTVTVTDNTMHESHVDSNGKVITKDRTFKGDEMKVVMTINGVTATKIYKVIA